jgi:ribosomal-protein-alanine N-acetyltransferase
MSAAAFNSERLRMRPQRIEDADALFEAYSDAELMRYWSSGPHADIAETRAYLAPRLDQAQWRGWAVMLKHDDRVIGTLAAGQKRPGVSEIGYLLVRSAWGRGYAREAVSRLIDLLVHEEGQRRVFADTDPDNAASNALLAALGFRREGLLRAEWETHIGVRDTALWGLLAEEWAR